MLAAGCATQPTAAPEPNSAQALQAGDAAAREGDLNAALLQYSQAASADPHNAAAHLRVASTQVALGNLNIAAEAYRRALTVQPDNAAALQWLGLLLLKQGELVQAKQKLLAAVNGDQSLWRAFDGLGILADLDGSYARAQVYYKSALALRPQSAGVHSNVAYSHYLAGNLDSAHQEAVRAVSLDPSSERAWSNLGLILIRRGDVDGGAHALSRVLDGPQAHYDAGYLCMLNGAYDQAERQFGLAIAQSPSYYAEAHEGLAQLRQLRSEKFSP